MKFLYFTDSHIRGSSPKSRKDNYIEALKEKFKEIVETVKNENIDYVLFGGDLFDRPDLSLSIVNEFIIYLKELPLPIYCVLGNHDIFGQNPSTASRTVLGILDTLGIVKLINLNEFIYLKKDVITIQLTGCPYYYNIDTSNEKEGYIVNYKKNCDFAIHIVHGMLLDKPFIKGVPHTLIDEIADKTLSDITLCGHYHTGFGIKKVNDKYFINIGSISRISNTLSEAERIPSYLIINVDKDLKFDIRNLKCAKNGDEIFDKEILRQEEFKQQKINEFIQQVNSYGSFEILNIESIIREISIRERIPDDIKDEAIRRIGEAQLLLSSKEGML
ncbi:DNA repair exonuclease SbcCD nuclease subunit [Caloramator quimbayensis]|uniref:DNA repair exonuclease SbcCD nuclease subunit n=1 Tax=Caloramator quimbayensis TaxID=1147123 RepID=A0A1T4XAY7_9CLOT|nr:metallophosphoesterase [Caloramator quimbayensis]SKA86764.1 DNA repair exonuclease SbcCD nuclease subunit [Caloramator quimbayensis]